MGEDRKLFTVLVLCILLSIGSLILAEFDLRSLFGSLSAEYRAEISLNERISLRETYVYKVKEDGEFTMLYRLWKAPVAYGEAPDGPHVLVLDFGGEGIAYVKDFRGRVFIRGEDDSGLKRAIGGKALRNELGIFRPEGFPKGEFRAVFEYEILPPVNYDDRHMHVNLKLADEHVFYDRVELVIEDSRNLIVDLYPHLPSFEMSRSGSLWVIEGMAGTDGLVEVEMVLRSEPLEGFGTYVPNVRERARSANAFLSTLYTLRGVIKPALVLFVLTAPYLLLVLYRKYGTEKEFTVPRFLSYVPNPKRKPWLVNMLFHGSSVKTDENALFATLLDMEERGYVEIELAGDDVRVRPTGKTPEDMYEKKVLSFISRYASAGGVFSSKEFEKLADRYSAERNVDALKRMKEDMESVLEFSDSTLVRGFLSTEGHLIIKRLGLASGAVLGALLVALLVISSRYPVYVYDLAVLCVGGILLANLPHLILPPQILGRWKGDYYRERLEWEAFRNFLSDLAMMKKYAPEDILIWKEWLLYAVALGVADGVEKAMDDLKVKIPEAPKARLVRRRLHHTYVHVNSSYRDARVSSSGGGGLGGGFGAGGGFGGGGAGGR